MVAAQQRRRSRPPRIADQPLPAWQQRSQETTDRLLEAAEALLGEGGAEAATLRAIADRAGVSPAIVYRRFPDKDAVLRAVYTRFFERTGAANARGLANPALQTASLKQIGRSVVIGMAEGYRLNRPLLRALVMYARTHPDPEFRKRCAALNRATFGRMKDIILAHRAEISHPDPDVGVPFALSLVGTMLQERILLNDLPPTAPLPQAELIAEVTRAFMTYLGVI